MSLTDTQLLVLFREGSADAFAQLVHRHIDWVWSAARRRVGDAHLAEDVTQAVFIVLYEKKPLLKPGQTLAAWLFKAVHFVSLRALRSEQRRRLHETEAAKMPSHDHDELPVDLDPLVAKLKSDERQSVLLRFYQQMSFDEVASELQISPETARKRVSRAIDKLREMLAAKGTTIPAAALGGMLLAGTTRAAPAGLAATTIHAAPLAMSGGGSLAALAKGAINMMNFAQTKFWIATTAAVVLVSAGAMFVNFARASRKQ